MAASKIQLSESKTFMPAMSLTYSLNRQLLNTFGLTSHLYRVVGTKIKLEVKPYPHIL